MARYVFDLEANGLLDDATVIHCAVFKDMDRGTVRKFIQDDLIHLPEFLQDAEELIGHNIIQYDLPLIEKILGFRYQGKVYDTVVLSRILNPNRTLPLSCPNRSASIHGLEAWGYRVGRGKPEHHDWEQYSEAMLHRCTEDVEINCLVYHKLQEEMKHGDWSRAVPMTMKLFQVFNEIEQYGWKVDVPYMKHLIKYLQGTMDRIDNFLYDKLPYVYEIEEVKVKGKDEYKFVSKPFVKSGDYSAQTLNWFFHSSKDSHEEIERVYSREVVGPFCRLSYRKLSLNKRNETVKMLLDAGWIPEEWNTNDDGERTSPKLSKTDPFEGINGAFGRHIARRVQARHRKSLVEGLLKLIRPDGRIASRITGLADTSRVKHAGIVNIPNVDSYFGRHIRKIFIQDEGKVLVGVDSKGNQVRQLTSLMGDDAYEYEVLHGDIHEANRIAAGLPTRSNAKTFFYGFLFGAGDGKIGSIVNGNAQDGRRLKEQFLIGLPKLGELLERLTEEWRSHAHTRKVTTPWGAVKDEYYNGWVSSIDGRPIYIKSEHAVLVYMLQNMEAIQMQYALLFTYKWLNEKGLKWGDDYGIVCFYHDEINTECKPEYVEVVGETVKKAIIHAGKYLKIKTPHDGDIKVGKNWYEIH